MLGANTEITTPVETGTTQVIQLAIPRAHTKAAVEVMHLFIPVYMFASPGVLAKHKFEDANTIDKTAWTFRRNAKLSDFNTIEELLQKLVSVVR